MTPTFFRKWGGEHETRSLVSTSQRRACASVKQLRASAAMLSGWFVFLKIKPNFSKLICIAMNGGIKKVDIDLIFKIAGTGIIVAVLNLVLKRAEREEQAMLTTLAGLIVVLVVIVQEIGGLFETVKTVFGLW